MLRYPYWLGIYPPTPPVYRAPDIRQRFLRTLILILQVLDDDKPTFESDVYSFGIIAWEIVSREMPWSNLNARAIFKQVLNGKRPEIPTDIAADVVHVIRSCWQDNPRMRPKFSEILYSLK